MPAASRPPVCPLSTPVDALKVTPVGNAPDSPRVAAGNPLAATVKLPALPTVNVSVVSRR